MLHDISSYRVTCSSQEAVQLYNKAVEAFVSLKEKILDYAERAVELDGSFLLARCFLASAYLDFRMSPLIDPEQKQKSASHISIIKDIQQRESITDRESKHVEATIAFCSGQWTRALDLWRKVVVEHPQDVHAARWVCHYCLILGKPEIWRDTMASFMVHLPETSPLYPHFLSLYAFALGETNYKDEAERLSYKALSLDPVSPIAVHTLSHVIEEAREPSSGIQVLISCRDNWKATALANHLTWHLTLLYLDLNQIDKVLEEYDNVLEQNMQTDKILSLLDAASLLWRLNVLGIDVGQERWKKVMASFLPHLKCHSAAWVDSHLMMSLCYGNINEDIARLSLTRQMIMSMESHADSAVSSDCDVVKMLGVPVCNALLAYGQERYDDVVSLLLPLRYDFVRFGGSFAQRQVFNFTLIQAAVHSHQWPQALALISELKAQKPYNNTLKRMFTRVKREMDKVTI